jgi:hypothetical protein
MYPLVLHYTQSMDFAITALELRAHEPGADEFQIILIENSRMNLVTSESVFVPGQNGSKKRGEPG